MAIDAAGVRGGEGGHYCGRSGGVRRDPRVIGGRRECAEGVEGVRTKDVRGKKKGMCVGKNSAAGARLLSERADPSSTP
jgi:hypothetical protein